MEDKNFWMVILMKVNINKVSHMDMENILGYKEVNILAILSKGWDKVKENGMKVQVIHMKDSFLMTLNMEKENKHLKMVNILLDSLSKVIRLKEKCIILMGQ